MNQNFSCFTKKGGNGILNPVWWTVITLIALGSGGTYLYLNNQKEKRDNDYERYEEIVEPKVDHRTEEDRQKEVRKEEKR